MLSRHTIYILICAILLAGARAKAIEHSLSGQISAYHLEARNEGERSYSTGIRYIPLLELLKETGGGNFIDLEASLNAWAATGIVDDHDIELYRLKLRYATARTETRLGLQTINFGPGFLLRPLRWFDRLDPRDPLHLTDGVYALRFSYVAQNNTNIWLWGFYGNDEPKGYEFMPTSDERPEFGGRLQIPVGPGELGATVHSRRAKASMAFLDEIDEIRFALDGRWDIEIGIWFEAMLQRQGSDDLETTWSQMLMVGSDYTLGIGSGLHILIEHMAAAVTTEFPMSAWDEDHHMTAVMLGYPIGYLDYIQAIGYYDWESDDYYQFLSWQRSWDNLAINLSLFHNPVQVDQGLQATAGGTGGQILLMYNH